jgi:hypothetical protein
LAFSPADTKVIRKQNMEVASNIRNKTPEMEAHKSICHDGPRMAYKLYL